MSADPESNRISIKDKTHNDGIDSSLKKELVGVQAQGLVLKLINIERKERLFSRQNVSSKEKPKYIGPLHYEIYPRIPTRLKSICA